jgi:hypothetical protein
VTTFRFDAIELSENTDARDDAFAQLAKMNLDSRSVTAPSGFCQTPRIALGKRARFNKSFEDEIAGRCNGFWRRISRDDSALI